MKMLVLVVASAVFALSGRAGAESITLDNGQAKFEGTWLQANSARDRLGDDYRHAYVSDGPTATATYTPHISIPGRYDVEIWYPQGANRSTNAQWTISCKGGVTTVHVNQQKNGGRWVRLASALEFDAGTSGLVRLSNNTTDAKDTVAGKTSVIADGVRLVPSGAQLSAAAAGAEKGGFTLSTSTSTGGRIQKSPDRASYPAGAAVQLTAMADAGYVFDGWTGDVNTLKNPLTLTLNGPATIRANFIAGGIGVIVDNEDPDVEYDGTKSDRSWAPSSQTYAGMRYQSHQFAPATAGEATAWATFRPKIPKSGKYDIYVWYLSGDNRSTATTWKITHKQGNTDVLVNQQINGASWFKIGSDVELEAGETGAVKVFNNTPDAGGGKVVIADAVAFVYVGGP